MKTTEACSRQVILLHQGEEIFTTSCIACHATSGAGTAGGVGPNLATFGDRNRVAGFMDHNRRKRKKLD